MNEKEFKFKIKSAVHFFYCDFVINENNLTIVDTVNTTVVDLLKFIYDR